MVATASQRMIVSPTTRIVIVSPQLTLLALFAERQSIREKVRAAANTELRSQARTPMDDKAGGEGCKEAADAVASGPGFSTKSAQDAKIDGGRCVA
jgi:hypothetical protein